MEATYSEGQGNGNGGLDMEKLARAMAIAMEQCGLEDAGNSMTSNFGLQGADAGESKKAKKNKIRVVSGDENSVSSSDEEEETAREEEDSPWEEIRSGIKKRVVTCSPLDPPEVRWGCVVSAAIDFQAL